MYYVYNYIFETENCNTLYIATTVNVVGPCSRASSTSHRVYIRESVDSLRRDDIDAPIP